MTSTECALILYCSVSCLILCVLHPNPRGFFIVTSLDKDGENGGICSSCLHLYPPQKCQYQVLLQETAGEIGKTDKNSAVQKAVSLHSHAISLKKVVKVPSASTLNWLHYFPLLRKLIIYLTIITLKIFLTLEVVSIYFLQSLNSSLQSSVFEVQQQSLYTSNNIQKQLLSQEMWPYSNIWSLIYLS